MENKEERLIEENVAEELKNILLSNSDFTKFSEDTIKKIILFGEI